MRAAGAEFSHTPLSKRGFSLFGRSVAEVTLTDKKTIRISQPTPDPAERLIPPEIYLAIDNDLVRDNVENDLPAAGGGEGPAARAVPRHTQIGLKVSARGAVLAFFR